MSKEKQAVGRPSSNGSRAKGRPSKRTPVSGHRDILTVDGKKDGFIYRWVNDVDNRLARFQAAGYKFVDHDVEVGLKTVDNPTTYSGSVVSKNVGQGVTAYLMCTLQEFYDEDQAAKLEKVDQYEAEMKRTLNSGRDGTYGKVEIKN